MTTHFFETSSNVDVAIKTAKAIYTRKVLFSRFNKAELLTFMATLGRITKSKEFQVASLADQRLVTKELGEMRSHFDLNYPSKWAGDKSRGWGTFDLVSEYKNVEGYDPRVVVHFPEKHRENLQPLKGVWFGKLVTTFETPGTCKHFVLVPTIGKGFALVDVGGNSCNYGQEITSVPSPRKVVYLPNYSNPECSQAYCPTIVSTEGYDFTKERSFLEN